MIFAPVPALGRRIASARVNGIDFTYSRHRQDVPSHAHRRTMIVLGVSGGFDEAYGRHRDTTTCRLGTALVRPAGEVHSNHFGPHGARDIAIEFDDDVLERLRPHDRAITTIATYRNDHLAVLSQGVVRELSATDDASPLALEALAFELLAFLIRAAGPPTGSDRAAVWMRRVREFIQDEWQRQRITLNDLASVAAIHPVHLARAYRLTFGETPAQSIRRLRTEWAAHALLTSSLSLTEVASQAGFSDQSHMTRTFRRTFGVTPQAWRQTRRRG
jgi:AraC family transcriptional regulator